MIIQTNVWICDDCGKMLSFSEEVGAWSDPVVALPAGYQDWGYTGLIGQERHVCPDCLPPDEDSGGL